MFCCFQGLFYFDVIDIGANAGWYSLAIASIFPNSRIYSFEPVPDTFERLSRNILLNSYHDRIIANNFAIHEYAGSSDFFFSPSLSGNSSFSSNLQATADKSCLTVKTLPLDDYVFSNNLQPSFVKIDVEGAELHAVKSSLRTLSTYHPLLFIELSRKWCSAFGYHPDEVIDLLASFNYRCVCLQDDKSILNVTSISDSLPFTNFLLYQIVYILFSFLPLPLTIIRYDHSVDRS